MVEAETKTKQVGNKKKETKPTAMSGKRLAVVLVRGTVKVNQKVKDTLLMLRLLHKNHCVVLENNPIVAGMLNKIKDLVTWGEIDDVVLMEMAEKKGIEYQGRLKDNKEKYNYNKIIEVNGKKYNKMFRLNPPQKGFGRKGVKLPFKLGGALGYRGEKMNDLIRRML